MQITIVVEKGKIGKRAPGIKSELGHSFLEAAVLQAAFTAPIDPIKPWKPDGKIRLDRLKARGWGQAQRPQVRSAAIDFAYGAASDTPFQASAGRQTGRYAVRIPCGCLRM